MLDLKKTPAQIFSKKLVSIQYSQTIIEDLLKIETLRKRSLKENYLLNSYIINLVASWQVFIQDLLEDSISQMLAKIENEQLAEIVKNNYEEKLKRFNTPNTKNIDEIFSSVLGISKITSQLSKADFYKERINRVLSIRHTIAHTGYSKTQLSLAENFGFMNTFLEAAFELQNITNQSLK